MGALAPRGRRADRARRAVRRARVLGFIPAELGDTPPQLARHVGSQIGVAAATFSRYAREVDGRTRRRHVAAVVEHAGWRACAAPEWNALAQWLTERALEHDTPTVLFGQALDQLHAERVVRPGLDRLMRAVSSARVAGRKEIRRRLDPQLTLERCDELDELPRRLESISRDRFNDAGRSASTPSRPSPSIVVELRPAAAGIRRAGLAAA